jgi:hypothetical protein
MCLADRDEPDVVRTAAATLRSGLEARLYVRESCGKTLRRVNIWHRGNRIATES